MKKIPNQKFSITFSDRPNTQETARTLLELCLNNIPSQTQDNPQGGFTIAIMRARKRVFDALATVGVDGDIELEDADFETARQAVADRRWLKIHADLIEFASLFGV